MQTPPTPFSLFFMLTLHIRSSHSFFCPSTAFLDIISHSGYWDWMPGGTITAQCIIMEIRSWPSRCFHMGRNISFISQRSAYATCTMLIHPIRFLSVSHTRWHCRQGLITHVSTWRLDHTHLMWLKPAFNSPNSHRTSISILSFRIMSPNKNKNVEKERETGRENDETGKTVRHMIFAHVICTTRVPVGTKDCRTDNLNRPIKLFISSFMHVAVTQW